MPQAHTFADIASTVATAAGRPAAFLAALAVVLLWAATGPMFHYSDTWQLVINTGTTVITFLMVFLLQHSTSRDFAATMLKLDTLIAAIEAAPNAVIAAEDKTLEEIAELKATLMNSAKS